MSESHDRTTQPKNEAERVYEWWSRLAGERGEAGSRGDDRAALARLRRCRSPLDALMVPAALSLLVRLPGRSEKEEWVAALAAVLGHVREHDPNRIARAIGRSSFNDEDSAKLSEGRFRRLMQAETAEELQRAMTRLMQFTGHRANVKDLAETMLYWGDRTRRRWTFDYYAVRIAAPDKPQPATTPSFPDQTEQPSA